MRTGMRGCQGDTRVFGRVVSTVQVSNSLPSAPSQRSQSPASQNTDPSLGWKPWRFS